MELYMISWQQGAGIASLFYINEERAKRKLDELRNHFTELQARSTTSSMFDIVDTLTLTPIATED